MDRSRGIEKICSSVEETIQLGKALGASAQKNTIFCLFGDLGAGKTTLIKGIAAEWTGIKPQEVSSPTFIYLNIYSGVQNALYHFDLYRLKDADEFLAMGFDDYLFASGITCIEWSERIASVLDPKRLKNIIKIELTFIDEKVRKVRVEESHI